jgi:hypothetical protein
MAGLPFFSTYAFADVSCTIAGPFGNATIGGPDTATAEEGLTCALGEETNTQLIGADGSVMNSLHSSRAGTVTIRLLKVSPVNQFLMKMYNSDRQSSSVWGQNTITITDVARGDAYTMTGCAFVRFPSNTYAKTGNVLEWEFHVALMNPNLGSGTIFTVPGT